MPHNHKCFVPNCPNSTTKTKDKVFVHVNEFLKRKWCNQLNIADRSHKRLYCCEDHFNLEEDLENYYQWKLMNARPKLKISTILQYSCENVPNNILTPIKESCQVGLSAPVELQKLLLQPIENLTYKTEKLIDCPTSSSTCTGAVIIKSINVSTQTEPVKMVDKKTLVRKHGLQKTKMKAFAIEESESPVSGCPSMYGFTSDTDVSKSELNSHSVVIKKSCREVTIDLIYKNPKMYVGLPKNYIGLIKLIANRFGGNELDILLTLMKIKLNDSLTRLSHLFNLSKPTVTKSLHSGVTLLASYFQHFVYMPTPLQIKRNLPLVFKIRYSNVQCIIDGFEIEIEKPSNPESQAQTWSQYKHCNTLKYIVGCTPNGFITYISKGYGGRTSDKALVEVDKLIDTLPTNASIMADRGFKEVESLLATKNIRLLRPPSVYSSKQPTQQEVLQTKVIASLRVHVERVIRRIREFRLLKPHSVVNHKHVGYIDNIVLIVCGLINLQNEIIKQ